MKKLTEPVESCPSTTQGIIPLLTQWLWQPYLTYHEGLPSIGSQDPLITWSCKIAWSTKNYYILPTGNPVATKLDRVVSYCQGLTLINSRDTLITGWRKFTSQIKNILHYQRSMAIILNSVVDYLEGVDHLTLKLLGIAKPCGKWKTYLQNHNAYIATKLYRVVTENEELPPIKSHDSLMLCSCEFTRQIKYIISLTYNKAWGASTNKAT